jgi:hypothetical protein
MGKVKGEGVGVGIERMNRGKGGRIAGKEC